jgi:hypothetical protein
MTTIQETPNRLTIIAFSHRRRLIIGLILLMLGLLVSFAIFFRLFQIRTMVADSLTQLPQTAQSAEAPSPGEVLVRLGYEGVRSATRGPTTRSWALSILSSIAGMILLAGYKPGQVTTFDKTSRQLTLVEPDRFFRPHIVHYPFEAISAVRVERDRSFASTGERAYTVQLEVDLQHSTGENSDFVYKKPILLSRYNHERSWAEEMAKRITDFIA